eukprot:1186393-Prorocentrum_minimum.AAC.4
MRLPQRRAGDVGRERVAVQHARLGLRRVGGFGRGGYGPEPEHWAGHLYEDGKIRRDEHSPPTARGGAADWWTRRPLRNQLPHRAGVTPKRTTPQPLTPTHSFSRVIPFPSLSNNKTRVLAPRTRSPLETKTESIT